MKQITFDKLDLFFYLTEWEDNKNKHFDEETLPSYFIDFNSKSIKETEDQDIFPDGKIIMFEVASCENLLNYLITQIDGYFEFLSKVFNPLFEEHIIIFDEFADASCTIVQDNKNVKNDDDKYEVVDLTNPIFSKSQSFIFEIESFSSRDYYGEYDVDFYIQLQSYLNKKYEKIYYGKDICPIIKY